MPHDPPHIAIIGAGIGGLATALRLSHHGIKVTVLERHGVPGGKMRELPTAIGPVDAGPTVLTMKPVFDALFSEAGLRLEDHVTLLRQDVLARHFWRDGTVLDLMSDPKESIKNVRAVFGGTAANEFTEFSNRAHDLFHAFNDPIMQSAQPSLSNVTGIVAKNPHLIPKMDPLRSLASSLSRQFSDPRMAQIFARYSTYVGGLPNASPALLALIWHVESLGVWHVDGGMHRLALALAECAAAKGATIKYDAHVTRIETQGGVACAVHTQTERIGVDGIVFNGDPNALQSGALGPAGKAALPVSAVAPRSLSAHVMSFAATASGRPLAAHNVFFAHDPKREYIPLLNGQPQSDPTLYVCAQDRFCDPCPRGLERFEVILNSPALDADTLNDAKLSQKAMNQCQNLIINQLKEHGLTFSPTPQTDCMAGPRTFEHLFPSSMGAIYGRSTHGMLATFKRPTARTAIKGLYLTGGGVHPGAGVPMAALSARHAAEAILSDLSST